jgi:hypothetical protein
VGEYFRLLLKREIAPAERLLERLENNLEDSDLEKGYLTALKGILVSVRTKSSSDSLAYQVIGDRKRASSMIKDLKKRAKNRWESDFDKGYFAAWKDYLKVIVKLNS